jgi:hypothetical protein
MKPGSSLAILLLSVVAFVHLLRLLFHVSVTVGGTAIPMWASAIGIAVPVFIAGLLWREAHASGQG